jgi:hypothetical protein
MFLRPQLISRIFLASLLLTSTGCSLLETKKMPEVPQREKVFFAPYEEVERAVKQAMIRYPAKVDNPDAGIFETDWVKDDLRFKPAQMRGEFSEGVQYRLLVRMIKGKAKKPGIKVVVRKETVLNRDFFANSEPQPSDGIEEDVILYRVARELSVEKALKRFQEKQNKTTN